MNEQNVIEIDSEMETVAKEPVEADLRQAADEAEELRQRLAQVEHELTESQRMVAHLEQRYRIDTALRDAETIDLEVARGLVEAAIEAEGQTPVVEAVERVQREKPYLFRQMSPGDSSVLSPSPGRNGAGRHAEAVARQAAQSGDRTDLMRYLRLRRRAT